MIALLDAQIAKDGGVKFTEALTASITRGYAVNNKGQRIGCVYGRDYEVKLAEQSIDYIKQKNAEALSSAENEAYN